MATQLEIVNRALQKIGAKRIASLTDDVKEAREVAACYDRLRDDELRAYNWRFAIRRFVLEYQGGGVLPAWDGVTVYAPGDVVLYDDGQGDRPFYCLVTGPVNPPNDADSWYPLVPYYGFGYAFKLPDDCLRVIQFGEFFPGLDMTDYVGVDTSDYTTEAGFILANSSADTVIRYVRRVTAAERYDANFVEMLACRIGKEVAETITASDSLFERLNREYRMALLRAARTNAIELPPTRVADDTWVMSRL